jgi:hypothetical protein
MGRLIMKAARAKSGNCILSDCGFLVTAAALSEAAFVKEIEREINIVDISSAAATDAFSCVFATKKAKSDQRVSVGKWRIPIETILPPADNAHTHTHSWLCSRHYAGPPSAVYTTEGLTLLLRENLAFPNRCCFDLDKFGSKQLSQFSPNCISLSPLSISSLTVCPKGGCR